MEAQPTQQPTPPPLSSVSPHHSYPDSVDSSPRSRNTDSWDEPYPPPTSNKLRLMCSYGGHIVPRPHDRSLCYVGGDTRILVVDRHTSLSDLSARLSKTFLNGNPFSLKYQLPSEDLDSLVSVTTDEDLDNMIDEYDHRTLSSSSKPSRIRLFLFPAQPNSIQSIGPVQPGSATTKSDDWFLDALNTGRVLSDSSSVNCLLGLDDEVVAAAVGNDNSNNNNNNLNSSQPGNGKNLKQGQDVHSVPDSPMLETNSSFGSTSSLPSIANLPPIRVHAEDGGGNGNGGGGGFGTREQDQKVVGIEEQFAQLGVGGVVQSSQPQHQPPSAAANVSVAASQSQTQTQPQSQALPPQFQQKSAGVVELPSPDSVSSDRSFSNAMSRPIPVIYQDQVQIQSGTSRVTNTSVDPNLYVSDRYGGIQMQQHLQEHGYVLQQQFDQQQQQHQHQHQEAQQPQQFMHGTHLIHHTPSGPVPIPASYYPVYQQQLHPQHHHQLDQQYQFYYVPARQAQPYNLSMQQANIGESATTISSSQPQNQPNPAPSAAYNPMRNVPLPISEMAAGSYRTAAATPQFVQVPAGQHQQQYVAYSQIHHHPSQPVAPNSAVPANYAYDYADSAYAEIFYTQPLAPSMPSQYQTMTPAEVSAQLPSDNMKQQMRTSQQL